MRHRKRNGGSRASGDHGAEYWNLCHCFIFQCRDKQECKKGIAFAQKKLYKTKEKFSKKATAEKRLIYETTLEIVKCTISSFIHENKEMAFRIDPLANMIRRVKKDIRKNIVGDWNFRKRKLVFMSLIYILEDDKNIQEIESYAIKGNGYDVRAFDDTEAFDRGMKEMKPDLLLLDVMLPGEDGLSVLKREIIMETVWGTDFIGESRTVDMHIKTLRKKLKEAGSLIITVRNVAYKLE